jgi:DNA polymerase-3 subunit delta
MLVPLLGGDRLASRSEIGKLALYARGKERVEVGDVMAVVSDASALAVDDLIDAAFAGKTGEVEIQFAKARNAGTSPGAILFAAGRQVSLLHKARLAVEGGQPIPDAVKGMWLHFSRETAVTAALAAWTSQRLARAMIQIADVLLETRKQAELAEPSTHRALLSLAMNARRGR